MTTALLDTNVLLQGIIGARRSASARPLDACLDGEVIPIFSPDTLTELGEVLRVPHLRHRHGWLDSEIDGFVESLLFHAEVYEVGELPRAAITRDLTDAKFLGLAQTAGADYLVTNDHRHLLPLKKFGRTRIVTPMRFLKEFRRTE